MFLKFKECLRIRFGYCVRSFASKPLVVTTPIFYVNAAPHIGHLYSAVIADACVRFERLLGQHSEYHFVTGTDEHGSKIQQAASNSNVSPKQFCDRISGEYRQLFAQAGINHNDFIRTTESRHKDAVAAFWRTLRDNGNIYKNEYSGWYCVADETFLTELQLKENSDGQKVSAESGHPVEWTKEENYMFRLSNYKSDLVHWIQSGNRIKPKKFEKILLDLLMETDRPLHDLSVSRPTSRVHWGISVPDDASQTIYVWLDALVNYLTSTGYPDSKFRHFWPPSTQVIGKDILKFHGIYWPSFLIAAGLEPPQQLLVHSHWTVDGEKMSKSKFNVVDPMQRSSTYTFDGLRYFLLREGTAHSDGNYSDTKVLRILNSELADTLGNLLSRGCAKTVNKRQVFPKFDNNAFDSELLKLDVTRKLVSLVQHLPDKCYTNYKEFNYYIAIDHIIEVLHTTNNFFETTKPWMLAKETNDECVAAKLDTVLCITLDTLRICAILLQPIVPVMSRQLLDKLRIPEAERMWTDAHRVRWLNGDRSTIDEWPLCARTEAILFRRIIGDKKTEGKKQATRNV